MSAAEIDRGVADANRIVWEDRPVTIRFVSEAEASRLPLRKETAREGPLRIIEISDFDLSACGGTHVARTGEIGLIAVLGAERFRGGTRLSFVCGSRALKTFEVYRNAVAASVRVLSVLPVELPAAIERVQSEARDLRRMVARLQGSLAEHEAGRMLADAGEAAGVRVIASAIDGWDAAGLKMMAAALARHAKVVAALASTTAPAAVVIARSADVAVDAGQVLRELVSRFGGRGGGKPELAQGGGLTAAASEIVSAAREIIEETVPR